MPGSTQEGYGCLTVNRFAYLLDDETDPYEQIKQAEVKKKEGPAPGAAKTAAQAAKQPKKESQKDRKAPLADKKEDAQAPVPLKKDGKCVFCYLNPLPSCSRNRPASRISCFHAS